MNKFLNICRVVFDFLLKWFCRLLLIAIAPFVILLFSPVFVLALAMGPSVGKDFIAGFFRMLVRCWYDDNNA